MSPNLEQSTTPKQSLAAELFGAGLFLLYAVVLFAHKTPPSMTDYANWTYQGVLLARHLHGIADPTHLLKPYPVPNSAATLGIGLFASILPRMIAAKLWLCIQMAVTYAAIRHFAQTISASGAVWWILPQAAFLSVNWWYGFVNFELGLAWVLLMASMLLRRVPDEPARNNTIGLLLVLAFFTHMIPFAFCGLMLLLYARQTERWAVLWQLIPSALLSLWYIAGRFLEAGNADGQAGMVETVRDYSAAFWAYKANSYFKSFGFVNPSSAYGSIALGAVGKPLFLTLLATSLILAALLGWSMIAAARRELQTRSPERFLWLAMLIFLPVFLLAPGTTLGVSDPGSRVLQTVLVLGIALACRAGAKLLPLASACGGILAVAGLFLFARIQLGPPVHETFGTHLPHAIVQFAHVPFDDQDYFYSALARGDFAEPVFPTGMFLNRASK